MKQEYSLCKAHTMWWAENIAIRSPERSGRGAYHPKVEGASSSMPSLQPPSAHGPARCILEVSNQTREYSTKTKRIVRQIVDVTPLGETNLQFSQRCFVLAAPHQCFCAALPIQCFLNPADIGEEVDVHEFLYPKQQYEWKRLNSVFT